MKKSTAPPALDWLIKVKAASLFCFEWVTNRTVGSWESNIGTTFQVTRSGSKPAVHSTLLQPEHAFVDRQKCFLSLLWVPTKGPHGLGSRRFGRWLCPEPSQRYISYLLEKRLNSCEPLVSWRTAVPWAGCWYSGENAEATEAKARPRRNRRS